jgi:Protein of unknown function (DUF2786)
MPDTKIDDEKQYVRVALQPDGLFHLVTGRDWLRSFCGLRLTHQEARYALLYRYGSDPKHCRECAAIVDQRAQFPQSPNEELKPILERIAKLFALTESPNENEAAAALARANQLLEKYNLTRGVVEDSEQQTAEKGMTDSLGANVQKYKYSLAEATARLHDVEWYRHQMRRREYEWGSRSAYDKHIVFVGLPANVSTALATYPYLLATAEAFYRSIRREHSGSSACDYKQGFADRIQQRVAELKREALDHPGIAALIRVGNQVACNAMRVEGFFFGCGFRCENNGARDHEAYQRGYRDGARVDLHGAHASRMLNQG